MIERVIYQEVVSALKHYPILAITGPRQSGKTTMLRSMFSDYRYVNLENPDMREYATTDPKAFLDEYDRYVIFDEVQRVPSLFSYLQAIVDDRLELGLYILSGSQNFHLMEQITQTLAGRVALFRLFPFDLTEMKVADWLSDDLGQVMVKGFYPAIFERSVGQDSYYANYVDTYVRRDVSQLANVHDDRLFRVFLKVCATRAGQLLNLTDLSKDVGVSHSTIKNWISILETSYVIHLLLPYYSNFGKRVIKSPKLYFWDTGLLCHLLNIRRGKLSPKHPLWGHLFENMVVGEIIKQNYHLGQQRDYYFWRDSHGHEVDLLYADGPSLHIYEVKSSTTLTSKLAEPLQYFEGISGDAVSTKTLIYGGDRNQSRSQFKAVAWSKVGQQSND
ncbi:MAG: ATP-binding protein [Cyclobacteriaceae bacterium]